MWKTTTIIAILFVSVLTVAYVVYHYQRKLEDVEGRIEQEVDRQFSEEMAEWNASKGGEMEKLIAEKDSLTKVVEGLELDIELLLTGGADVKKRQEIMRASEKREEKLKLRKGEVFKDKVTGLVLYVKPDFYENRVLVNLTFKNKNTMEEEWDVGKYYYYMDEKEGKLSEVLMTYLDAEKVELDWVSYWKK